jgi:hypothetical protein
MQRQLLTGGSHEALFAVGPRTQTRINVSVRNRCFSHALDVDVAFDDATNVRIQSIEPVV